MKFRKQTRDALQLNLTPLIDVVFLLLIFFMVTTTFTKEHQLRITLPEAQAEQVESEQVGIFLLIQRDGNYALNGQVLANSDIETLMSGLREVSNQNVEQPLILIADAQATHQAVVTAMDAAGRLGFVNLRISTQESDDEAGN